MDNILHTEFFVKRKSIPYFFSATFAVCSNVNWHVMFMEKEGITTLYNVLNLTASIIVINFRVLW